MSNSYIFKAGNWFKEKLTMKRGLTVKIKAENVI